MSEKAPEYRVDPRQELRHETRLPYSHPDYSPPGPDDFRLAMQLGSLTGAKAGELVGVTGRAIRRYVGGDRDIPYSVWRLLLVEIGLELKSNECHHEPGKSSSRALA